MYFFIETKFDQNSKLKLQGTNFCDLKDKLTICQIEELVLVSIVNSNWVTINKTNKSQKKIKL